MSFVASTALRRERVTWEKTPCWMANDAVGQEKQKEYIIQKANILSFQGPTALFALQKGA